MFSIAERPLLASPETVLQVGMTLFSLCIVLFTSHGKAAEIGIGRTPFSNWDIFETVVIKRTQSGTDL